MGLIWETVDEINLKIAKRIRNIRKRKKISQSSLAEISNVSLGSIKRFENTGDISLYSLTKIAFALDCEDQMQKLFDNTEYKSIEEIINEKRS